MSRNRLPALVGLGLAFLTACNFPRGGTPTAFGPDLVLTYAALTVQARLTLAPADLQPTFTPGPPGVSTTSPPVTPTAPGTTNTPGSPGPQTDCDRGAFEEDITIPDDTVLAPGEQFTKTWQLRNTGTCTWNSGYSIVFDEGDSLGGPASAPLTDGTVPPEGIVDVSLDLQAPQEPGEYQGFWILRNSAGQTFGLGDQADKNFWVKIQVGSTGPIAYDFNIQAKSATWIGSGGGSEVGLAFDGADDDPNGVAKLKKDIILENGKLSGVTLVTGPRRVDDGVITGTFPEYTVQNGDHFLAKLGFLENCSSGQVVFQFGVKEGANVQILEEWEKACDGTLILPDINLAGLAGRKVQFILAVLADGSSEDDLVIWGSARIER